MGKVRNTMNVVENTKGKIDDNYSLYVSNIMQIEESSATVIDAIVNAFCFGYAQGQKATKAEAKRA